jgi:iron complex outermembrane receptor protein
VFGQWDLACTAPSARHELLTVETQAQTQTSNAIVAESNASPTVHQGVEAGLLSPLWGRRSQR